MGTKDLAQNAVLNSRTINGKSLSRNITLNAGDVGAYNKGETDQKFQPQGNYQSAGNYALKGDSYTKSESDTRYQAKGNYQPASNYALKGESYIKTESDSKYQPKGSYATAGSSYTKSESDGRYQPKGNYQPTGNYAVRGESYTKKESDGKYQPKGNYLTAGYNYSKSESDTKYQPKGNYSIRDESYTKLESDGRYQMRGTGQRWRKIGDFGGASSVTEISLSENCLGKYLFVQRHNTGGGTMTGFLVPPISSIRFCVPMGSTGFWDFIVSSDGKRLKMVDSAYGAASSVYIID
ncbi:conserved hypothetical protein [Xenorhabdus nematophila str. Anatoliense]|nr:conserved hypothetical protein [Xenorhabdus nematophila str. Anatoliense]